jgi:hypothetical protein
MFNQASFDKIQVQFGNRDKKTFEYEEKFLDMESECHTVRHVDLYPKSETQPMGIKEMIDSQKDTFFSMVGELKFQRSRN